MERRVAPLESFELAALVGRGGRSVRFRHLVSAGVLAALASSCSLGDSADVGNINLYLEVDDASLSSGEVMNITVTARNVGYSVMTLTGPSDCLLYVDVLNNQGTILWSSNTSTNCKGGSVTESLQPGQDKVQTFQWHGENLAGGQLTGGYYNLRGVARVTNAAYQGPLLTVSIE